MSFKDIENDVLGTALSALGEDVTYTYAVGGTSSIKGVFDNQYIEVNQVVTLSPTLTVRLSDLSSSPRKGDSVIVSSVSYRVLESRPDGYGGSTLVLQKV